MRLLGVVVVAIIMYVAVPLLWQRAMVDKVKEVSASSAGIPMGNAVEVNWAASENLTNAITQHVDLNQDEINQSEQIGVQSAADESMRQAQAASDRAWAATHSN